VSTRNLFAEISEGFEALQQARQGEIIRLTPEEEAAFAAAMLNPPPISERLQRAAEQYAQPVDVEIQTCVSPRSGK